MNILTQVDWYQLTGNMNNEPRPHEHTPLSFQRLEYGTKLFSVVYRACWYGKEVATIAASPRMKHMNPKLSIVKFANWLLYSVMFQRVKEVVCDAILLTDCRVSRVDIAMDFERFENGWTGHDLIRAIATESHGLKGSKKLSFVAANRTGLLWQYMRVGSGSSHLCWYVYNKSAEMREVTHKPWIAEKWAACGMGEGGDVWRLEFRVAIGKGEEVGAVDEGTGELEVVADNTLSKIEMLSMGLCKKHIRVYEQRDVVKKNRLEEVELFGAWRHKSYRMTATPLNATNRYEKSVLNLVERHAQELRELRGVGDISVHDWVQIWQQQHNL